MNIVALNNIRSLNISYSYLKILQNLYVEIFFFFFFTLLPVTCISIFHVLRTIPNFEPLNLIVENDRNLKFYNIYTYTDTEFLTSLFLNKRRY